MQKVGFDAGRREIGRVRFEEHDAHNVVADVALPLQLRRREKSERKEEKKKTDE